MNRYDNEWNVIIFGQYTVNYKLKRLINFMETFDCLLCFGNKKFIAKWLYTNHLNTSSIIKIQNDRSKNAINSKSNLIKIIDNLNKQQNFVDEAFKFLNDKLSYQERQFVYKKYKQEKSNIEISKELKINFRKYKSIENSVYAKFKKYFD